MEIAIRFSCRLMRFVRNEYYVRKHLSNVMVIGAGDAGAEIIKEMRLSKYVTQKVCCVIDDNPAKISHYIEGCQIVGNRNDILDKASREETNRIRELVSKIVPTYQYEE